MSAGGTSFSDSVDLPSSESTTADDLLAQMGADDEDTEPTTGNLVWRTAGGSVTDATVVAQVQDVLAQIAALERVEQVVSPCDAAGAAQLSADGTLAFAALTVTEESRHRPDHRAGRPTRRPDAGGADRRAAHRCTPFVTSGNVTTGYKTKRGSP